MKGLFPQYDYTASADYAEVWKTAIFVFDTNVLLNLYRYQERTREELLETLAKLSDRIWIPHHVALEFQRNRLTVIAAQGRRFSDIRKVIEKAKSDLGTSINNLQLTKRHTLIDPEPLTTGFERLADNFLAKLEKLKESQQTLTAPDPIKTRLEDIFDGKVGSAFSSQDVIDEQHKRADSRYKAKIPPGYKDADKDKDGPDDFSHNGLTYKRKFGDHMVWNQILTHAAKEGIKKLIFITDDAKEDWWEQIEFDGPKTVGPRAELIEEAARIGMIETFLMYKPEGFLTYAKTYLAASVSEDTLSEVRDVSSSNRAGASAADQTSFAGAAEECVHDLLLNRYGSTLHNRNTYPDFIVGGESHRKGFEVKCVLFNIPPLYRKAITQAMDLLAREEFESFTIVFVIPTSLDPNSVLEGLSRNKIHGVPGNLFISVAKLQKIPNSFKLEIVCEDSYNNLIL